MNARQAALIALDRCAKDGAWAGAVLDGVIKKEGMDRREASLATALALGVLQNRAYFDFLISRFCTTPPDKLERKVRDILRLGVCQLASLDRIPARAAVNETVALCAAAGVPRAASLVNAVLRRIAENIKDLPQVPGEGTAACLATRYSHPLWLAERFVAEKGYAFTEALFAADNAAAPLDIQINTLRIARKEYLRLLEDRAIPYELPPFPESCVSLPGGSVPELPGYGEGLFYVQDRAARTAVDIAGLASGMRLLDACASPGGKSFAAAIDMQGRGEILSCDIHEKKLASVSATAERLGLDLIKTARRDAREFDPACESAFDAVIADVPCSGLGVIRKKPEIRCKEPDKLGGLPAIQRDILNNLSRYVRPGGTLLYCTCTILREENEAVVEEFLSSHKGYSPCDFEIGGRRSENGCYTFWPHIDGTDGFFAAKMRRADS
ncbi:MAG: 16S rRNA (cytosine(967)-C(5))-methyltransferase RsmB [Oscillospiraceae bacterium]|nr:16S rRNA (cytosine(967)-C(5))-methyltransferase RsmB [Oscillospiraceae bacterium]